MEKKLLFSGKKSRKSFTVPSPPGFFKNKVKLLKYLCIKLLFWGLGLVQLSFPLWEITTWISGRAACYLLFFPTWAFCAISLISLYLPSQIYDTFSLCQYLGTHWEDGRTVLQWNFIAQQNSFWQQRLIFAGLEAAIVFRKQMAFTLKEETSLVNHTFGWAGRSSASEAGLL